MDSDLMKAQPERQPEKIKASVTLDDHEPLPEPTSDGSFRKLAVALAAAAVIGLGALFGVGFVGSGDNVSADDLARIEREFAVASQTPLMLGEVSKDQVPQKVSELGLAGPDAQRMVEDIQSGKSRMLLLGLVDYAAEDGDIVSVSSGGLAVEVALFKGVNMVAIPVAGSGPAEVTVTGVYDGGGGITISGSGPNGQLPLPAMTVGQSVSFSVQ